MLSSEDVCVHVSLWVFTLRAGAFLLSSQVRRELQEAKERENMYARSLKEVLHL